MELDNVIEFKSSPEIIEKLSAYGNTKIFSEGDVILYQLDIKTTSKGIFIKLVTAN